MASAIKEVRRFESSVAKRPEQFLLGIFDADDPPELTRGYLNFLAQVFESPPDHSIRVAGSSRGDDGEKIDWWISRNQKSVYEFGVKGRMFVAGDFWTIGQHFESELTVRSAGSWFVTDLIAEAFQKRTGSFRKWASGAYTEALARESIRTTIDGVISEIRRDDHKWNEVFFPASRETVKYSVESEPHLLERMISEVGKLLGRPIVPFRNDSHSSRMERLDRERPDSTSPSSGAYRQQLGLTPIERGGRSASEGAKLKADATTDVQEFSDGPMNEFSLRRQMKRAGFESINQFFDRIDHLRDDPREIQRIVDGLLRVTEDDDLGRVMARLMYACSYVSMPPIADCILEISGFLGLAGISRPQGEYDQITVAEVVQQFVVTGIETSRQTRESQHCVNSLRLISQIWCSNLPSGIEPIGRPNGRAWMVATVIVCVAEAIGSSDDAKKALGVSLQGGNAGTLRDQVQTLWNIGRNWAQSRGIDFDEYVRQLN